MIRPKGSIRLKVSFKSTVQISDSEKNIMINCFKRICRISEVTYEEVLIDKKKVSLILEYPINISITGVINSLKTNSSREIKKYFRDNKPNFSLSENNLETIGFQSVNDPYVQKIIWENKIKNPFWERNYSYESLPIIN
jgi:REP element-mobilizing transposase RayT